MDIELSDVDPYIQSDQMESQACAQPGTHLLIITP